MRRRTGDQTRPAGGEAGVITSLNYTQLALSTDGKNSIQQRRVMGIYAGRRRGRRAAICVVDNSFYPSQEKAAY